MPVGFSVWPYLAVTIPFVFSPGPTTVVVLRNGMGGGVRSGVATAIGANAVSLCYGVLSALGVSLALQHWPAVWGVLRIGGAGYLAWLGGRSLWRACRSRADEARPAHVAASSPFGRSLREGFVTNLLNASIAAFYFLIIPTFVPRGAPAVATVLLLTAIHVTLAMTWHLSWAVAGAALADRLSRDRPRRILQALTGVTLLALALKVGLA